MTPQISMIHGDSTSLARCPSLALLLWYKAKHPDSLPDGAKPFTFYYSEDTYPTGDSDFLVLVVAACEREFNRTPTFDDDGEFETQCLDILQWLHEHGDIDRLTLC